MSRLAALLLLAAAVVAGEPTRLELAPAKIPLGKQWFGVYLYKQKSGFASRTIVREKDAYVIRTDATFKLKSMGKTVDMSLVDEMRFALAPPFGYVGGSLKIGGPQARDVKARREGDKLRIDIGTDRDMAIPAPDFTLADALASELWVQSPRAVGDTAQFRGFSLVANKPSIVTMRIEKVEELVAQGVPMTYYSAVMKDTVMGPLGTARISARGETLSTVIGSFIEMRREPEATAKKLEEGGDLFFATFARPDKELGDPRLVRALVLEVTGEGAAALTSGPQQTVTKVGDGVYRVALGVKHGKPVPATEEEIAANLEESVSFPVAHETIRALARGAVGDAKTVREKVDRLVHFVSRYVEDELRPEPVDVLDVVRQARGDCQEHSILFATLARAAGVPARTVAGFGYVGGKLNAFGGHAWNEVVIDGHWVPVDATWDETVLDAAHIRVGAGIKGLTSMSWALGSMKLKVIEIERDEGK